MFSVILIGLLAAAQSPAPTTRVLNTDPLVTYSGMWYTNNSSANTTGLAALTNAKGAMASITFTGTGITWYGVDDSLAGIAWIFLDGQFSTIDTYAGNTLYQQPVFAVHNLAPGTHTLAIEIPHIRNPLGQGSWVWIDRFEIENGAAVAGTTASAGRVEDTSPAIATTGTWYSKPSAVFSGGSSLFTGAAGARATFSFSGTSVIWMAYRDQWAGIANVYVDGALKSTIDTYQATAQAEWPAFSATNLQDGPHTLTIEATGTNNPASGGAAVWVDAFQVVGTSASAGSPLGAPAVSAGGVVSAASFSVAPNNQVAPGQIVSIFGKNFASGRFDAMQLPLPQDLGPQTTTVTVCGVRAPLYNIFPGQINAQLPNACPTTGTMPLTVTVAGQASSAENVTLVAAAPALFTLTSAGAGQAIALHGDYSLVSTSNPARPGEQVMLFGTGFGATNPAVATGVAAMAGNVTVSPVTATIGGQNATVAYAGLVAGFAGLYQVNVVVPMSMSGMEAVVLTVGGQSSPAGVTMMVASVTP